MGNFGFFSRGLDNPSPVAVSTSRLRAGATIDPRTGQSRGEVFRAKFACARSLKMRFSASPDPQFGTVPATLT